MSETTPALLEDRHGLTDLQRKFVEAMIATGGHNQTLCAKMAGYTGTEDSLRVIASKNCRNPKILAAIRDAAEAKVNSGVIIGAQVLLDIANDPTHKDRFKAATALLDRGGLLLRQESKVIIETSDADKAKLRQIIEMANRLGLDPKQLLGNAGVPAEVIDAEFTVVQPEDPDDPLTWSV